MGLFKQIKLFFGLEKEDTKGKSETIEYTFTEGDIGVHTLSFPQSETLRNIEYDDPSDYEKQQSKSGKSQL